MASHTASMTAASTTVGMGQIAVAESPASLTAVLGSCLGVTLYHRRSQQGILAHVVLPNVGRQTASPGKFVDTAIPNMLQWFKQHGIGSSGLIAKLTGGACMFGSGGPMQIGASNAKVAKHAFEAAGVRVAAEDLGGNNGRRITLDCSTGTITVETIGSPARTL